MKRISCAKLGEILDMSPLVQDLPFVKKGNRNGLKSFVKYIRESCEAYGRDVRAYLNCGTQESREWFEAWLRRNKIAFCENYWPGSGVVEIKVTYFKAWHWDE